MNWTPTITSATQNANGNIDYTITLTPTTGSPVTVSGSTNDPATFVSLAKDKITQLQLKDAVLAFMSTFASGQAITIPTSPGATQADIDLSTVQRAVAVVALGYYLVQLNWIGTTNPTLLAVRDKVLPLLAVNVPKLYT